MTDERVWLSREIDGTVRHFHCPAAAVEGWQEMGWEPSEAPPEPPNAAVAHLIAAAEATAAAVEVAAAPTEAAEKPARQSNKPTKPAAGAENQE